MNPFSAVDLSPETVEDLSAALFNVGQSVGKRDHVQGSVHLALDKGVPRVKVSFRNKGPDQWGIPIGTVRRNMSTDEVKVSVNHLVDEGATRSSFVRSLLAGVAAGSETHAKSKETSESLEKKAVVRLETERGTSAFFEGKDDANVWANHAAPGDGSRRATWMARGSDTLVSSILATWESVGGPRLEGLWLASVPKTTTPEAEVE